MHETLLRRSRGGGGRSGGIWPSGRWLGAVELVRGGHGAARLVEAAAMVGGTRRRPAGGARRGTTPRARWVTE